MFAVSLAAQLGTIPFTAYYFSRVSIISLVANIPVVPISGINTFIGAAEIMIYPISPLISKLYAAANDFLVWFLLGFVKQAASVPFAYMETWHFPALSAIGYFILLFCTFNLNIPRIRVWMFIFFLIAGNIFLFEYIWNSLRPKLVVTIIDVGQGDAVFWNFPMENECWWMAVHHHGNSMQVNEQLCLS